MIVLHLGVAWTSVIDSIYRHSYNLYRQLRHSSRKTSVGVGTFSSFSAFIDRI